VVFGFLAVGAAGNITDRDSVTIRRPTGYRTIVCLHCHRIRTRARQESHNGRSGNGDLIEGEAAKSTSLFPLITYSDASDFYRWTMVDLHELFPSA